MYVHVELITTMAPRIKESQLAVAMVAQLKERLKVLNQKAKNAGLQLRVSHAMASPNLMSAINTTARVHSILKASATLD